MENAGHKVIKFELDKQFQADEHIDVLTLTGPALLERYGRPDFVWASPPCTAFSVASMGHHWHASGVPKTEAAWASQELVWKTRELIDGLNPRLGYLIENPRGMLRKLPPVQGLPRHTVTYCAYGDSRMKPTDLWGYVPGWAPRPMCSNGDPCHEAAPRGSSTGTQGRAGAVSRAMVPYSLGKDIQLALDVASNRALDV